MNTHQNQQNTQTDNTQEVKTSKSDSQPPKNSKIKLIIAVVV
ncbi:HlyD family secretion protein, partial [Acinetobacter baumannii]|nr:HlyD family secretion protein [Acinetobacter baumannii]